MNPSRGYKIQKSVQNASAFAIGGVGHLTTKISTAKSANVRTNISLMSVRTETAPVIVTRTRLKQKITYVSTVIVQLVNIKITHELSQTIILLVNKAL